MKSTADKFDLQNFIQELGEVNRKLIKGTETLAGIDEIDVGTAPKELVYERELLICRM